MHSLRVFSILGLAVACALASPSEVVPRHRHVVKPKVFLIGMVSFSYIGCTKAQPSTKHVRSSHPRAKYGTAFRNSTSWSETSPSLDSRPFSPTLIARKTETYARS